MEYLEDDGSHIQNCSWNLLGLKANIIEQKVSSHPILYFQYNVLIVNMQVWSLMVIEKEKKLHVSLWKDALVANENQRENVLWDVPRTQNAIGSSVSKKYFFKVVASLCWNNVIHLIFKFVCY